MGYMPDASICAPCGPAPNLFPTRLVVAAVTLIFFSPSSLVHTAALLCAGC